MTGDELIELLRFFEPRASSCYKDSNATNFIIVGEQACLIDYVTITFAPAGYDFAKLLLTYVLREGIAADLRISTVLRAFRLAAASDLPTVQELLVFSDMHWVMCAPFAGKNGYRVAWPEVRAKLFGQIQSCQASPAALALSLRKTGRHDA